MRRAPRAAVAALAAASLLALGLGVTTASAVEPKVVVQGRDNSATSLDVSWTKVEGADAYRVQYSTDDRLKKSVKSAPDVTKGTETTITGLKSEETYFVRVTALDDEGAAVGDSTVVAAKTAYPYAAPGDVYATKVTKSSMTLSWRSVGKTPAYAVEVSGGGKKTTLYPTSTSVGLSGLKPETVYAVKVRAAGRDGGALSKDSPSQNLTTSGFAVSAPDGLKQGGQGARSFELSWSKVDTLPKNGGYVVEYSLTTTFASAARTKPVKATKTVVTGLRGNQTYYTRIYSVNDKGSRVSAKSDYITTKTIVGRGTLAGSVSGAPSGDLMAVAYDRSGSQAAQVPVSDGRYKLAVRPEAGPYKVQVQYVGAAPAYKADAKAQDAEAAKHDYTSLFAHTKGSGWTISQATSYRVAVYKTTKVADIRLGHGNYVRGTVKVSKAAKSGIRDVDVTAITGANPGKPKQEREVIGMARTDAAGNFIIAGLPDGPYWLRFNYVGAGKGYKLLSRHIDIDDDLSLAVTLAKKK